jgi:two-component system CheB/CheR fusion protein
MLTQDCDTPKSPKKHFPVAGIGTSAGGLEASQKLVATIPADSGMAFILVQHLHPDHESALADILCRDACVPVVEITDNMAVHPNHVYVVPAGQLLVAGEGSLKLIQRSASTETTRTIDLFFASLAEVYQANAIGVILSGKGADGTEGLKDIKDHGGITFAQQPDTAAYPSMPQSAIDAGTADFVLPPENIPPRLMELTKSYRMFSGPHSPEEEQAEQEALRKILSLLRLRKDVDFTLYKQTTIRRRIIRRMVILKMEKIKDYSDFLKKDKHEQDLLFQDLLIPVTSFFRDQRIFNTLFDSIFPSLLKGKSPYNPLRIWVPGCSTGQEAYSIAIGLLEHLGDRISTLNVKVFASDIVESSVSKARSGCYVKKELKGIAENLITRFFDKKDGIYQVKKVVRDMCVFATHNFLKDPPFAKMDLISCRNALIYMEPFLQTKALTTFHYALKEKGILWLGKSESTGEASDLFIPLDKKDKFYQRKSVQVRYSAAVTDKGEASLNDKNGLSSSREGRKDEVQKSADEILLARFTPAAVVVNEHFDIVQVRGSTGDYLEPSPGKASLNILKMAREGLSFEIRNALHKAKVSRESYRKENIPLQKGRKLVCVEVIPLVKTIEPHFLIVFSHEKVLKGEADVVPGTGAGEAETARSKEYMRIRQLENELELNRENMRIITEAQEAAYAQLQTANEELLSSDEELQSLNEELETSKEELQSTNEELHTLNSELSERNEQLNASRQFAEAIIETLHEAIVVLEENFYIRRANKAFYHLFRLSEEKTVGKVLFSLEDEAWNIPALHNALLKLREEKKRSLEIEFEHHFPSCGERCLRVHLQLMQGYGNKPFILTTIEDVTLRRKEEERLNKLKASSAARQILHHFFMQTPAMLCILQGPDHVIDFANAAFTGALDREDVTGKKIQDLLAKEEGGKLKDVLDKVYRSGEPFIARGLAVNNKKIYIDVLFQSYRDNDGRTEGILLFCYDVTNEINALNRNTEAELKYRELVRGLPVAVYLTDVDGHITLYNKAAEQLWGRKPELGKDIWHASWNIFRPDGSPLSPEATPMAVALTDGRILNEELMIENPSGERRHVIAYPKPIYDSNGSITGAVNTLIDITEQALTQERIAASELRFRQMANNIPSLVWVCDDKGNRNFFNKSWQAFTGRDPSEDQAMGWTDLVHTDDLNMVMKIYMKGMQDQKAFKITYRLRRHDGKYRWMLMQTSPVFDLDGRFSGFLATCNEIHEQKMKEQKKDEFLSIASHEMKTPLSSAKAYLQLFRESIQSTNEEAGLYIKKASKSVERLETLIAELLDVSKIQNGKLTYNFSTFNFGEMLEAVVEAVQYTLPRHTIVVEGSLSTLVFGV